MGFRIFVKPGLFRVKEALAIISKIEIEEAQLIQLLKDRQQSGFDYLYDRYSSALMGIALRVLSNNDLAEEVVHDTFMKVWNAIASYDTDKGRLFTWMARICKNSALDMVKSKGMRKQGKTDSIDNIVSDREKGLSEQFNTDTIGVKDWLQALNTEQREVVEALYFQGMSQSQAAEALDIPLGTVKTRLRIGLRTIREHLNI